jgi:hypothetical protein
MEQVAPISSNDVDIDDPALAVSDCCVSVRTLRAPAGS